MNVLEFRDLLPEFVSAMQRRGIIDAVWGTTSNGEHVAFGHLPNGRPVVYKFVHGGSWIIPVGDLFDRWLNLGIVDVRSFAPAEMQDYVAQS